MIEIDGSYGEGGGQILRTSLALSSITGLPLHIRDIRKHRRQPGLRPQHLTAAQAIAIITRANLVGACQDATDIYLHPNGLHSGKYRFDIPTAGALTLVLQTVFLPLSFAGGTSWVKLTGGTHVPMSPIYHYLQEQWLPMMLNLGFRLEMRLAQAGFFPRGGGEVDLKVMPVMKLSPFRCTRQGALLEIRGFSGVANLGDEIGKRQKHRALQRLYAHCRNTKIQNLRLPSPGQGTFILLRSTFSPCGSACFTALGAPGKPAEQVADEATDSLIAFLQSAGCVDHYLADQLLLPLSMVQEPSEFSTNRITDHLLTNAHVIQQFLPVTITIEGEKGGPGIVRISNNPVIAASIP